ncbi:hypothetical protein RvY_11438-1 [Ramazzottius varieornatus]|uniref:Uncharacterized protein n=1 Tax=Ramazzottius varieornatus TaxID=947166 RepID=A0A1D1VG62_RAMVA|nr:hypothetical protein RvY_11438-1 [Ramazzottius varieornatus]
MRSLGSAIVFLVDDYFRHPRNAPVGTAFVEAVTLDRIRPLDPLKPVNGHWRSLPSMLGHDDCQSHTHRQAASRGVQRQSVTSCSSCLLDRRTGPDIGLAQTDRGCACRSSTSSCGFSSSGWSSSSTCHRSKDSVYQ